MTPEDIRATGADKYGPLFEPLKIPRVLRRTLKPVPWEPGLICGPTGTGKSHRAAARLLGAGVEGKGALFVSVPEFMHSARRAMQDKSGESENALYDPVLARRCLVLDDLGAQKDSDWTLEQLYMIVNYRQSNLLETVVTTNLAPDALGDSMGERLASRLFALGEIEEMVGLDRRLAQMEPLPENLPYLGVEPFRRPEPAELDPEAARRFAEARKPFPGPGYQKRVETIWRNCGFADLGSFEAFWKDLAKAKGWPPYPQAENDRRMELFRRASHGEQISRAELANV